ncbi:hypothetical protein N9C98_01175 [Synechococcus sp. AH-224-G16]|nr:hypothetical protein [Synechococcus sp. AH-224-G16]
MNEENGPQWNEHTILSGSMNHVPAGLFRSTKAKETVVDKKLSKQLQLRAGEETIKGLAANLIELQNKPPAFAHAAMADCILSLEALIKQHATTDPEMLQVICGSFGVALANAATTYKGAIIQCDDDEIIYDYSVEEVLMDDD